MEPSRPLAGEVGERRLGADRKRGKGDQNGEKDMGSIFHGGNPRSKRNGPDHAAQLRIRDFSLDMLRIPKIEVYSFQKM